MDQKRKLLVFDRGELLIVFVLMILIALISFTLGMRIGKEITYKKDGFTLEDKAVVEDLKSVQEESVDKVLGGESGMGTPESSLDFEETSTDDSLAPPAPALLEKDVGKEGNKDQLYYKGLEKELEKLKSEAPGEAANKGKKEAKKPQKSEATSALSSATTQTQATDQGTSFEMEEEISSPSAIAEVSEEAVTPHEKTDKASKFVGKYTIQLGSHRNMKEAQEFADGFAIRGYNPIINEVKINGKGTWYRVSLGTFDTVAEAKEYISKEESLFQGQDYIITEIK